MRWFSALIVFESEVNGSAYENPLRECSVRILLADAEDSAKVKAERIGRDGEHAYQNADGEMVVWKFREVAEVQDLSEDALHDGIEVFSRIWRVS